MLKKLDHVSILAVNPEPVISFYTDFLGFVLDSKKEFPNMSMNIFKLIKGDDYIELIQPTGKDITMKDGIKHIAFLSDDIDADFNSFLEKGAIMLHKEIQRSDNVSFFFIKSPHGEFIEVIQYS